MDNIKEISLKPISFIKEVLVSQFGEDWHKLEEETMSLDLGIIFDDILLAKIRFLKVMEDDPERFYEDPMFFLHSCDILNNVPIVYDVTPAPTSIEVAYAFEEVSKMYPHDKHVTHSIKQIIIYILTEEGYSKAHYPFTFIQDNELPDGNTEEDSNKKGKAIQIYLQFMSQV